MRVLQIGSDRAQRGILFPGSAAFKRQEAYAEQFGALDVIGFSLRSDGAKESTSGALHIYPTNSVSKLSYMFDAVRIAKARTKPEVVSAQDPFEVGLIGWLIARRLRVPLHVQVHTDFLSPEYARHSVLNRLRVFTAGFILRRAARVRVVSERVRESLEKEYHLRVPISVLPIFADLEHIRAAKPDTALVARFADYGHRLLVVSRLESEKNVALALESFAQSAPQDACLIVVGDGSERERLEAMAHELGIAERISFEGSQDAAPYYSIADLVLVPSKYEGYGLVIIEALAAGKPVISTDVGVAREAGAIVTSPEAFVDALKDWFSRGPRTGELKHYPYNNFEEYVHAYCDDIAACVGRQKSEY